MYDKELGQQCVKRPPWSPTIRVEVITFPPPLNPPGFTPINVYVVKYTLNSRKARITLI